LNLEDPVIKKRNKIGLPNGPAAPQKRVEQSSGTTNFSLSNGRKLRRENKKKDGVDVDLHYIYEVKGKPS
jgi:hypothetical protein